MGNDDDLLANSRRDTPGTKDLIHFNNAGAALCPEPVLNEIINYLKEEARIGGYEAAAMAREKVAATYEHIAALIGATPGEIAYVDSATRAWNTIVYSLNLQPGDRILVSPSEFGSNIVSLAQVASRSGARIEVLSTEENGQVSLSDLYNRLDEHVKLIAITHVPAHRGLVNPVAEIGERIRNTDAFYLVDACQSVGHIPIDVSRIGCHALTATGRKWLRGPRGTGFLFLHKSWITRLEPTTLDLAAADLKNPQAMLRETELDIRPDIKRFEVWERSFALMIGLGVAANYACEIGIDRIHDRVTRLASLIRTGCQRMPGVHIEDAPDTVCGIVTMTSDRHDATEIKAKLAMRGINTSVMQDYDSPIDFTSRRLAPLLRVSPHYYNSEDEVAAFLNTLDEIVQ